MSWFTEIAWVWRSVWVGLKSDGTTGHLAARRSASRYMARATRQATELTTV